MSFITGNGDPSIPEGNDPEGSNTSDNTRSEDAITHKSHHVISEWRTFRANLVAQEQVLFSKASVGIILIQGKKLFKV